MSSKSWPVPDFGALELAVRRFPAQRQTCGGADEFDSVGTAQRHDPYAYLKDVLARLPTQKMSQIDELLPHKWQPA